MTDNRQDPASAVATSNPGSQSQSGAVRCVSVGHALDVDGAENIVIGYKCVVNGNNNRVLGNNNVVRGHNNTVLASNQTVNGDNLTIVGPTRLEWHDAKAYTVGTIMDTLRLQVRLQQEQLQRLQQARVAMEQAQSENKPVPEEKKVVGEPSSAKADLKGKQHE